MTKKTLQQWYSENSLDYKQKSVINNFGVNDYYPEYALRDLRKLWYWNDILIRNSGQDKLGYGSAQWLNFFSAWWNNNLILVVEGSGDVYYIRLIVYEMPHQQMREIFEVFCVGVVTSNEGGLSESKNRVRNLESKLSSDNPILSLSSANRLEVTYYDDSSDPFFPIKYGGWGGMFKEEVKRVKVDFNSARYNPDAYFKPLDIAMIYSDSGMVHTCIYLGNRKICHALGGNQVRIEDWNGFFFFSSANKMVRYHPVIAFKKSNEIIKHIANCVEGQETYYSPRKKRDFDIYDNNCENFTNRCVLGLNFSQLAERKNEERHGTQKKEELNVTKQLNDTKRDLDALTGCTPWNKISEIKGYQNQDFNVMRDGIRMEARIEVQPKSSLWTDYTNQWWAWQRSIN